MDMERKRQEHIAQVRKQYKQVKPKKKSDPASFFAVVAITLAALSLVYTFAVSPIVEKHDRKTCHKSAIGVAADALIQAQEFNANLQNGEQPIQIDDVAIYDTEYRICIQSKGL